MSSYQICIPESKRAPTPPAYRPGESTGPVAGTPYMPSPPPIHSSSEGLAWCERAGDLADWALASVIVRTDCYLAYKRIATAGGIEVQPRTIPAPLTREHLIRHFGGKEHEDRIGVHIVFPIGETCKVTIVDIDAHGPDDDPEANWAIAREVARRAIGRGALTRVFDSNGAGGYHIWVLHPRPIPCAESYLFGKWLVHEWDRHGLRKEPESFPKSPELTGKRCGQTIRLPGRHHKRPHWTAVWDGVTDDRNAGFLRGAAAVAAILETGGRPDRIPPGPLVPPDFALPTERFSSAIQGRNVDPDELDRDAALAREALAYLGGDYYEDYDCWVGVGMSLRQLGDQGLAVWHEWSAQSRSRYRPEDLDQKWRTFAAPASEPLAWPGRRRPTVGLGSLFVWAKREGWTPPRRTAESMAEQADRYQQALLACPEMLTELASRLEVTEDILQRLGVGWKDENFRQDRDETWVDDGPAWTFPVASGSGEIIGIQRQFLDETVEHRMVPGSKSGLHVPAGWECIPGPVLIPESVRDVAYLIAAGGCAIGRPAVTSGVDHLARLLRGVDRSIVVIAEDDRTADGRWPGKKRAVADARELATRLGRRVKRWLPRDGCEGVRDLVKLRRDDSLEA
jgi:hypothetical protein